MNHSTTLRHSKSHRAKARAGLSVEAIYRRWVSRPHGTVPGDYSPLPEFEIEVRHHFPRPKLQPGDLGVLKDWQA
jgi:hypothetical protein